MAIDPYANRDAQIYQQLTEMIGAWSKATGVAPPSAAQFAQWERQYGQTMGGNLMVEAQNVGWYAAHDRSLPTTTGAKIKAAAEADPRWAGLDANGRAALEQMYNLQQTGYSGEMMGLHTPMAPLTTGPTGPTGIKAPANGMTSTQVDAWAQLRNTLASYGFTGGDLNSLVTWAKNEIIKGNGPDQIAMDLQNTAQFKRRFPAIGVLAGQGVAITPAMYISMEQSYAAAEHGAGIPVNFASYDALIANQVSPTEYQDRLQKGYLAVAQADPTVIQAFQDYYGVTKGQLAAYFLNPQAMEPILTQRALAAQIGGASAMAGFHAPGGPTSVEGITQAQALRMAQLGVTQQQAQQGFQKLGTESQLYNPLPGAGHVGHALTADQLLNAQFGSDAQTQLELQQQAAYQAGTTKQGGTVGQTQAGATGLGTLQR